MLRSLLSRITAGLQTRGPSTPAPTADPAALPGSVRPGRMALLMVAALLGLAAVPVGARAQTFDACYVPNVGAIYLINLDGLPTECLSTEHVAISWSEGMDGSAAGGDLTGTYPAPEVAGLRGQAVSPTAPASGQVLSWSGSEWVPTTPASGVTDHGALSGLADDDHGQYLLASGVRTSGDGFAVTGSFGSGSIPLQGGGTRMMWYPGKAAFRAGRIVGSEWDDANVGDNSVGLGFRTTASATSSVALGNATTASGLYSFAVGSLAEATGNISSAFGFSTVAQSFYSMALGRYNVIEGTSTGWVSSDPVFVVGNGTATTRSNALTLLKNGNLIISGTLTQSSDIRLKEEVEPLDGTLDRVLRLTPLRYRFRPGTGHPSEPRFGLSAQEVEPLFPELVLRDSRGYLSVAYADLSAVLVRSIQEQQEEIEELRSENQALHEELEARLGALEAAVDRLQ